MLVYCNQCRSVKKNIISKFLKEQFILLTFIYKFQLFINEAAGIGNLP